MGVSAPGAPTSEHNGVLRHLQAPPAAMAAESWDGRRCSHIPVPPLDIDASIELHTQARLDVDAITYQVLRSRLWHKNLEHGDVIQRVSGSAPVVYSRDYATAVVAAQHERGSRQVYWYEQGGFADTALPRPQEGGVGETLEGPLLIELPDTVVVVRPGQSARFGELGGLTIEL